MGKSSTVEFSGIRDAMKTIRTKWLLGAGVVIVCCAIIGLFAYRVMFINSGFPNSTTVEYGLGEKIQGGDIDITALDFQILDSEQLSELLPDYTIDVYNEDGSPIDPDSAKTLLVEVNIVNDGTTTQTIALQRFCAESLAWSNGLALDEFKQLNNGMSPQLELEPGQAVDVRLPYSVYALQFMTDAEWQEVDDRPFSLVLSLYPTKHLIRLG